MKEDCVSWGNFTPHKLSKHKLWHDVGTPSRSVCVDYICLDTETSKTDEDEDEIGWLYQWCFNYPDKDGGKYYVYGRRPSELAECLERIININGLDDNNKLIIYAHNMSYDFAYIKEHIMEKLGDRGNILATAPHRLISWKVCGLEFRDSLKIAMRGLDKWGRDLNIRHKKLVGEIDYDVVRYQDSQLCKSDWRYMIRDVRALDECVESQLKLHDDTTKSIPLTNTGYVRRLTRKEFRKNKSNRTYFNAKRLNVTRYKYMRNEFAGGITHGNRFYADMTIDIDKIRDFLEKKGIKREDIWIAHGDFCSHYPSQQITKTCPGAKFVLWYDHKADEARHMLSVDDLLGLDKSFLCRMQISDLHIRDGVTLPYAQEVKFRAGRIGRLDLICDNGRILHMLEGASDIIVNEHDIKWLVKQYKFKYKILKVFTSEKKPYPEYIRRTVMKLFYDKTYYKKKLGEIKKKFGEDTPEYRAAKIPLDIAKGMLNSIYGMTATDPVRVSFTEDEDGEWHKEELDQQIIRAKLDKFFLSKNSFMNYELGLWTTSLARDELLEFVELIGYENFIYADTDSIFYISTPEIRRRIAEKNEEFRKEADEKGYYVEVDNERTYLHQFEDEGEKIIKFRFLHAKCYAYITEEEKEGERTEQLHCTVAGVKSKGKKISRVRELGDIENLISGFKFTDCGGTITKYPGREMDITPRIIDINGHQTEVASFALIEASDKTLKCSIEREESILFWEAEECYE